MRAVVWVVLALLGGCEHAAPPRRAPAKPAPTTPLLTEMPCLADKLEGLRPGWMKLPDCTADNVACHEACLGGDADACFARAIVIERDHTRETETVDLFSRACRLGLALGCTNWAAHQWAQGSRTSKQCVMAVFKKACSVKEAMACGMVGRLGVEYSKSPADLAQGKADLESACSEFKGPPCRMLAYYVELGKFGPPDRSRIKALMILACEGGDDGACGDHATVEETFSNR